MTEGARLNIIVTGAAGAAVEYHMIDEGVVAWIAARCRSIVGKLQIGMGRLPIVGGGPDAVAGKREAPVPVAEHGKADRA